jgi:predicted PurR-regulated permease PerM
MIERANQAQWIGLMAVTAIALYLCWSMVLPFVEVIVWAAILVVLFAPAHAWILSRTRRPVLSAVLSVLLVLITVIVPLGFVTSTVLGEVGVLAGKIQDAYGRLRADPSAAQQARDVLAIAGRYVDLDRLLSSDEIKGLAARVSQWLLERSAGFVGGLVGILVRVLFTIFTLYYLFRDREAIVRRLPEVLPLDPEDSRAILARTREIIAASVYGVLVIALIQGTLGGVMFWILGIPSAVVWAVLMTVLCMIPMAGSALVWAPAALYLGFSGEYMKGAVLFLFGLLVIGTVDNFLRPRLVGGKTRMHELFIFFSVLGGLQVFGVVGLLVGPVVLAITLALLEVLRRGGVPGLPAPSRAAGTATGPAASTRS